ncbi:MAG TPA: PEP-CTERM sorting domain-containing protein [Candidatus Methylacidiphilales bacterium]|jgi:hypothetical protein|nr:PEP-CTERM sorting domain-containing protein [Candidatus Methylacidiphilales bacterium]
MKTSLTYLKNHLVCFGAAALLLLSVSAAKAQILLNIQVSNTGEVTITATGTGPLNPVALDDGYTFGDGVDLLNFFQKSVGDNLAGFPDSSSLTTGDASGSTGGYNAFTSDGYTTDDTSDYDLNLYNAKGGQSPSTGTETFSTGTAAFTGTMTINLNSLVGGGYLPTGTMSGQIVAGYYTGGSNPVIGQWQLEAVSAPEPSAWMLLTAGLGVVGLWRLRLAKARAS